MIPTVVSVLNVLLAASNNSIPTSCQYHHSLMGTCEIYNNCPFYFQSNLTDHGNHFPTNASSCSSGYICCPHKNLKLLPTPPTCGFDLAKHIGNGHTTSYYNFRFVVLLQYERKSAKMVKDFLCAGSLINNQYVVSAAHCVKSDHIINYWDLAKIRLGEWNLNEDPDCIYSTSCADNFVERSISEVKIHPKYADRNRYIKNDIMLIRLDRPIHYTDFIKPTCLPIFGIPDYSDDLYQIVGWGRSKFNGPLSTYKQSGLVRLANPWSCANVMDLHVDEFNKSFICTTEVVYDGKSTSPCFGDSGGPLLQITTTDYESIPHQYLTGIISTGDRYCNSSVTPTLHTNVVYYINWIIESLRP